MKGLIVGFGASIVIALYGLLFHLDRGGLSSLMTFKAHIHLQYVLGLTVRPIFFLGAFIGLVEGVSLRQPSGQGLNIWAFRLAKFAPSIGLICLTCWLTLPHPIPLEVLWVGSGVVGCLIVILVLKGIPTW